MPIGSGWISLARKHMVHKIKTLLTGITAPLFITDAAVQLGTASIHSGIDVALRKLSSHNINLKPQSMNT